MLTSPPRDQNGVVTPHNHAQIRDGDGVIRRISEKVIVTDKSGRRRISSIAFNASSGSGGGMSVDLEALIAADGVDPRAHVTTPLWTGSVRWTAGDLRRENFMVGYDPIPDNKYHGEVWGAFSKPKQRQLAALAVWFVQIDGVDVV